MMMLTAHAGGVSIDATKAERTAHSLLVRAPAIYF
jgi:hypothetical protein